MHYERDECWCPCHGGLPAPRTVPTDCDLCAPLHVPAPKRERPTVSAGALHFPSGYKPFIPPSADSPYKPDPPQPDPHDDDGN